MSYNGAKNVDVLVYQAAADNQDYAHIYSSNVAITSVSNSSSATLTIDGNVYNGAKAGSASSGGYVSIELPVGATKVYLHAKGWSGDNTTISIAGNASPNSLSLTSDPNITGSGNAFTITTDPTTDFFVLTISNITEPGSRITIYSSAGNQRFVIWGVNVDR